MKLHRSWWNRTTFTKEKRTPLLHLGCLYVQGAPQRSKSLGQKLHGSIWTVTQRLLIPVTVIKSCFKSNGQDNPKKIKHLLQTSATTTSPSSRWCRNLRSTQPQDPFSPKKHTDKFSTTRKPNQSLLLHHPLLSLQLLGTTLLIVQRFLHKQLTFNFLKAYWLV